MFLHDDRENFEDIITQAAFGSAMDEGMIEKDYYVTMLLRECAASNVGYVFKGGTSLSKCYKVIDRFSEDIDLTVRTTPTQGQRYLIADTMMRAAEKIGLTLKNRDDIRRRRDFNRYVFEYESVFDTATVSSQIIVEIYVALLSFPVDRKSISSLAGEVLAEADTDVAETYGLLPFEIDVQDIRRTLIDKVFALCDYYLSNKSERYSRHIYDIYQILGKVSLQTIDKQLVEEVRKMRSSNPRCLSAHGDVDVTEVLREIAHKDFFKNDYRKITETLLFKPVPYERAVTAINQIIQSELFVTKR